MLREVRDILRVAARDRKYLELAEASGHVSLNKTTEEEKHDNFAKHHLDDSTTRLRQKSKRRQRICVCVCDILFSSFSHVAVPPLCVVCELGGLGSFWQ